MFFFWLKQCSSVVNIKYSFGMKISEHTLMNKVEFFVFIQQQNVRVTTTNLVGRRKSEIRPSNVSRNVFFFHSFFRNVVRRWELRIIFN